MCNGAVTKAATSPRKAACARRPRATRRPVRLRAVADANPELAELIESKIGTGYRTHPSELQVLNNYADDKELLDKLQGRGLQVVLEPGRRLVGNAGLLLTKIEYLKEGEGKNFAIIDAAMNDLMRPALYEAWHDIDPVVPRTGDRREYDVVGPVCETGDFLGQARPLCVQPGDLLAVMSAGAYGMAMASNYNTRPRAVEVMVDGDAVHVIRQRETVEQLYAGEQVLPV